MSVSVESTSNLGRRINISVPDTTLTAHIQAKLAKIAPKANLKGFRPGKVPKNVLEKRFGQAVRYEAIEELVREQLEEVIRSQNLQPVSRPEIETIEAQGDLQFSATFEVYPEINLVPLSDVTLDKKAVEIAQTDIDQVIEKLTRQHGSWHTQTRPIQNQDKVKVEFSRLLDSPDATLEHQPEVELIVGTKGMLPGLNELLLGQVAPAELEMDFEYPAEWSDKKLAGQKANLKVKLVEVQDNEPISIQELAQKLDVAPDDTAALNQKVEEKLLEQANSELRNELKELVLEKLLEKNPIELPKALIDNEKNAMRQEMARHKSTLQMDDAELETTAKHRVELGLLLNEVIKKYALKADSAQVRAEIEKIAQRFPEPAKMIEAYYHYDALLQQVERTVLLEQAVDTLLQEVTLNQQTVPFATVFPDEE